MALLASEVVETSESVDAVVIWLHGLGASGDDFVPIVPELRLPSSMGVRFIFPHAPELPVTINGGMSMPAWYDIISLGLEREVDTDQILISALAIKHIIEDQIRQGIASDRIVIAGFSQGGAVAYEAALTFDQPLAGLIAMSTYFATYKTIEKSTDNQNLPVFISHGLQDAVVSEVLGGNAQKILETMGYQPVYQTYSMEHSVHPQQIADISAFIQTVLK